ncbi:MAG: hypothetical protein RLZ98_95 [Pseudomonadota bacterium]
MITLEDCLGFSGLPKDAILAVAEHERVPEVIAAGLASNLVEQPDGYRRIAAMIADDTQWALKRGRTAHAGELRATLEVFVKHYPEAMASVRVRRCLGCDDGQ